jgi:ribose transport system substrate-binding protein
MLTHIAHLTCRSLRQPLHAFAFASIALGMSLAPHSARAADARTVAYIAPSLDISYWQWVGYGVKERAKDVRTALTRGVSAIVMGPVSSASTPQILRVLKEKQVPIAFAGIGPQPGQTDYTSAVTANNYETGKAQGSYVCKLAKERGSNKVGMLSLPQDRENAQKYLTGAKESFKADGCDLTQMLETHGLTVSEAVAQANDILTAHPDIRALYGMYDEAGTGAAKALQTRGMTGKVAIVTADGSPTTIKLLRDGAIQGLFLQEAVGQGIDATTQVSNALTGKPTTQQLALKEPLVTKETIDQPDAQKVVKRVYPPSAGKY